MTVYRYPIPIKIYMNHLPQEKVTYVILPEHNHILACTKKRNKSLLGLTIFLHSELQITPNYNPSIDPTCV